MKIPYNYDQFPYLQSKLTMAKIIRDKLPKPIPWIEGSINVLYQEIAECLIFGLNHSAISLCGGFLEHVLRLALYERVTTARVLVLNRDLTKDPIWQWLECYLTLDGLIKEAKREGIIRSQNKKWWDSFPKKYRNIYSHCKIFSAVAGETEPWSFGEPPGNIITIEVPAQISRAKWAIHKSYKDHREALSLFREVTDSFLEIAASMNWTEREPNGMDEDHLARKYRKFFTEDWGKYETKFLDVPEDFYADY